MAKREREISDESDKGRDRRWCRHGVDVDMTGEEGSKYVERMGTLGSDVAVGLAVLAPQVRWVAIACAARLR